MGIHREYRVAQGSGILRLPNYSEHNNASVLVQLQGLRRFLSRKIGFRMSLNEARLIRCWNRKPVESGRQDGGGFQRNAVEQKAIRHRVIDCPAHYRFSAIRDAAVVSKSVEFACTRFCVRHRPGMWHW